MGARPRLAVARATAGRPGYHAGMPAPLLVIGSLAAVIGARHIEHQQREAWEAWFEPAEAPAVAWPATPAHGKSLAQVLRGVDDPAIPWLTFPALRDVTDPAWGAVLTDVMQHLTAADAAHWTDGGAGNSERATDAHEGTHGIHFSLRYARQQEGGFEVGAKVNTLYVLDDRYVMLLEPPMSKAEVAARVPQPLRAFRFQLYVAEQEGWNDRPLYLWDEWVAYTNDCATMIDREQAGLTEDLAVLHDSVQGPLEFSVYALATLLALSEEAPQHLADHPALAAFTAWNLRRAFELYELGRTIPRLRWEESEAYVAELRTGASAAALRDLARALWGPDWTKEVMGF